MTDRLHVDATEARDRAIVLTLTGDLDLATAPDLYQRGAIALADHPMLVLDLAGVTFCDSSGLNALIRLRRRARETGGRLVLTAPSPRVRRLLIRTGTGGVFPIDGDPVHGPPAQPASGCRGHRGGSPH